MINSLGLAKFKGFKELPSIGIPALTILSGRNSAGKSSILHSLLLLKQSLRDAPPSYALILDGQYLQYSHLREISFGLPQEPVASLAFEFGLSGTNGKRPGVLSFEIRHKSLPSQHQRKGPVVNKFSWAAGSEGESTSHTIRLRKGLYVWPKNAPIKLPSLPSEFAPTGRVQIEFERFLPAYVSQPARYSPKKGKPETALLKLPLLHFVESPLFPLIEDLRTDLTKLRYLGPSRAIPRRAYVHYSEVHYDLDEDGGNAAHVLWLRRNEKVRYREESVRLEEAVDHCMELMGLEQQLTAKRSSKIVYQVLACLQQSSSKKVTLADIGFGYSQVLPIVLRGLLADDGALILYEQPEIHLHPSAKARLADLFLAFVESGKRVIVETHSTELINKLQLLTIRNPKIAQQTNVVFVEPSPHGISEGATARELKLRSDGLFEAWPDGFADESERLAREILEESVQRGGNTGA